MSSLRSRRGTQLAISGDQKSGLQVHRCRDCQAIYNRFTRSGCHVYTDEYDSYNGIERPRSKVAHGLKEWARDDDGDGIREVHTNTTEGMGTGLRNFLRPFRGVHKRYLCGYVAVHECSVNLKRISHAFISALVKVHSFNR